MASEFVAGSKRNNLFYSVTGKNTRIDRQQMYSRAITEETLKIAKLLEDIVVGYPSSWIKDYRSVEIEVNVDGEKSLFSSPDNVLTEEQKEVLSSLKTTSGIAITVNYNKKNYNDHIEKRQMNVSMVVVPEVEAEYPDGYNAMIQYLRGNSLENIHSKKFSHLPQPTIAFVVNEHGETESVRIVDTSRDKEIDELLVNLVKKMPTWIPAKTNGGIPVKQEFVLTIGQDGC
jgi:hypothetical protein